MQHKEDIRLPPGAMVRIETVEKILTANEEQLMEINKKLGDILEERYNDRMGYNTDGSFSRKGKVIWPERMVEDE
jgi:hypothetical protein